MKNFFFILLTFGLFTFAACGDDDSDGHNDDMPDYHISFITPAEDGSTSSMQGQTLSLEIEVEDHHEGTVHHVNVKIFKKDDEDTLLFDGPVDSMGEKAYHVHETSGKYVFTHELMLDPADVDGHTDWTVLVKAWGHEDGAAEKTATTTFHVHPM